MYGLLVCQGQPRGRFNQQRRAASRDQHDHAIPRAQTGHAVANLPSGLQASFIRYGMRGLEEPDALQGQGIAIAGDNQPLDEAECVSPVRLQRMRHRSSRLASPDDDGAAAASLLGPCHRIRAVGQGCRYTALGPRRVDGCVKQVAQQVQLGGDRGWHGVGSAHGLAS